MTGTFPTQLALVQAHAGNPVDLARLQDTTLRTALEELRALAASQNHELRQLRQLLERRTGVLSPSKGFSNDTYSKRGEMLIYFK